MFTVHVSERESRADAGRRSKRSSLSGLLRAVSPSPSTTYLEQQMDFEPSKLKPLDPTLAKSVRHLAKSVSAVASQLVADLHEGSDMAASLLWCHGELERLSI